MSVIVYTFGLCHCSVCAPKDMAVADVVAAANVQHPTGLDHGWEHSDEAFATGQQNPCECNTDSQRLHYLMVC